MPPLKYYFYDGSHVIFNKYIIENGIILNTKTRTIVRYRKNGKYNRCSVYDNYGKARSILVSRAIASSIIGPPPSSGHTADHIDRNTMNDNDDNIRWLCKRGQSKNRKMPDTLKTARVVVKDGIEKTINEWVVYLKDQKNHMGHGYTNNSIKSYAQKKQHGFSYKEYPTLPGEIWKEIEGSKSKLGRWEISNMSRVKYITAFTENVLSGDRLGLSNGYPSIRFDEKSWGCHVLAFMTFFPDEYENKKPGEMVLHEDDDRLDFRPHKLRLGTQSENTLDAYNNGKYDGTKSARAKCVSYVNGVFEKEHDSQDDAVKFLKSNTKYIKATKSNISLVVNNSYNRKTAYGRTWKLIE